MIRPPKSDASRTDLAFSVLVVEDEELFARAIGRELARRGIPCDLAFSGTEGLARAAAGAHPVILLDHRLPDADGLELVSLLLARRPETIVVVMTAYQAIAHAVQAIRRGAEDYVVKETSVLPIVERVVELEARLAAKAATIDGDGEDGLVGCSPALGRAVADLRRLVRSPKTTVLLTGETGVGKELAARHLHRIGAPPGAPMIAVDCLSVPAGLAESLLFGHERGAFTGADQAREGAFGAARDGTIFLDEIGDIGDLQGKLLRVLESRTFRRVGSLREEPLRARVVVATNRDLAGLVRAGTFRRDLYERLSAFPIDLPPLRERREDIPPLAEHFRDLFTRRMGRRSSCLDDDVMAALVAYPFPGNVRELRNIVERAVILAEGERIHLRHLPERVLRPSPENLAPSSPDPGSLVGLESLASVESQMIRDAMRRADNVKARAARLLGISRYRLLRRMEKYRIRLPESEVERH